MFIYHLWHFNYIVRKRAIPRLFVMTSWEAPSSSRFVSVCYHRSYRTRGMWRRHRKNPGFCLALFISPQIWPAHRTVCSFCCCLFQTCRNGKSKPSAGNRPCRPKFPSALKWWCLHSRTIRCQLMNYKPQRPTPPSFLFVCRIVVGWSNSHLIDIDHSGLSWNGTLPQ